MLVFIELYSAKLIAFCCLSIVVASYMATGVISFSQLRTNTQASSERNEWIWCVFLPRWIHLEWGWFTATWNVKHCLQWIVRSGTMSGNEIHGFIFMPINFKTTLLLLLDAFDPLGYDSDLQRICIIKLVEKKQCFVIHYGAWHSSFFKLHLYLKVKLIWVYGTFNN